MSTKTKSYRTLIAAVLLALSLLAPVGPLATLAAPPAALAAACGTTAS